jgi:PKD repeat protein
MTIDTAHVQSAYWHSFATNAGPAEGNVFFNGNSLGTNVFTGNTMTADAKVFDVKSYITDTGNEAAVQGTESGGMGAIQQVLMIEYNAAPVAAFSADPVSGTAPLTVLFTDTSSGNPTTRVWDFGDGNSTWSTTETTFAHTYAAAGTYDVMLTVSNAGGSDDETKIDYITASPAVITLPGQSNPPTDPDSDGLFEDLNANNRKDMGDVVLYFENKDWIAANEPLSFFDFNGNLRIDLGDVVVLFEEMV